MNRKEKFKKILLFALLILLPLISINSNSVNTSTTTKPVMHLVDDNKEKLTIIIALQEEVSNYISGYYRGCPEIIPKSIVNVGLEQDIDICFMMAQAEIETCFGKTGLGRATSRYSLFGVEFEKYSNYPQAVKRYAELLKKSYLVNGKNEQSLLKRYVNKNGNRYAVNPRYEATMRSVYNKIVRNTRIKELQQKYKKLSN